MYVHTLTWCVQHRSLDTEARRRIWTDICVERVIGWWAGQWNWNTDTVSSGTCWRFILWYLHTRAEEKDHRPATLIPTSSSLLSPSWLGKLRLTNQLQRSNWTPDGHTEEWRHLKLIFSPGCWQYLVGLILIRYCMALQNKWRDDVSEKCHSSRCLSTWQSGISHITTRDKIPPNFSTV